MEVAILKSELDDSVNFVQRISAKECRETRYVRRGQKYFAVYLSSQTGCRQGCFMCHLTATKQTMAQNILPRQYIDDAGLALKWYDENTEKAEIVHFNFMARGEAMDNPYFLEAAERIFQELAKESADRNLIPRFLISTIMPKSFSGKSLSEVFPLIHPEIYYSIYSVKDAFKKRWLPNAMPVDEALSLLNEYQANTKKIIKLHWAFIKGENDSEEDVVWLCHKVNTSGLRVDVAIVRYNPYSEKYGEESSEETIRRNAAVIAKAMPFSRIKTITRVGLDVKASCGMFVEPDFTKPL